MHQVFAPDGALAATLPGYEARAEQAALAAAVERALASGEHLVAEAGTGTGKSLAYLIPALESGQRVVVATATKALQEQLLAQGRACRGARRSAASVRVAVLKGRQNYLCRKQLQGFGPMLLRDPRDEEAFDALQPWLDETETGDRAELPFEPSEALWAELAVGADRCAGRRCPFLSTCFAEAARAARRRGRARDREPRALLRRPRGGRRRAARARRGRSSTRRTGSRRRAATWLGGRVSRARPAAARGRRRAGVPRGGRASARRARSTASSARATGCCAPSRLPVGRRRLREPPAEPALVLVDALAALADELHGRGRGARPARARARSARPRRSRPASSRARSSASSGPSPTRSPGRRSTSRASCASGSGTTARRRSSSRRR